MQDLISIYSKLLNLSKNIIVYGASGTGKTFTAKKIIENIEKKSNKLNSFEKLQKEERVTFISFHKNYSYESFVERFYLLNNEKVIENGILKKLAINASLDIIKEIVPKNLKRYVNNNSKIWKISLGYRVTEQVVYDLCKKNNEINIGWLENQDLTSKTYNDIYSMLEARRGNDEPKLSNDTYSINSLVNEMKIGDFVLIFDRLNNLTDIVMVTSDYIYSYERNYPHKRKVKWLLELKKEFNMTKFYDMPDLGKTIYEIKKMDFSDLRTIIFDNTNSTANLEKINKYYLLIDNMDMGDIISIFGDTISLIDKENRSIQKITLSFSKKEFSLPENLYIIGVLNSDTSEILNPTLKRKFGFIKTSLNYEKLKGNFIKNLDIYKLALFINSDDKSFRIPVYYFLGIKNIEELYLTFYFKILPFILNDISTSEITLKIKSDFMDTKGELNYLDIENFERILMSYIKN